MIAPAQPAAVPEPPADVFGNRLKEIRKRRGLSQVELARRLGLHQSLISQYECGYLRLHGALLVRLAQALDTTPDEILTATPPTPAATEPRSIAAFSSAQACRQAFTAPEAHPARHHRCLPRQGLLSGARRRLW